MVDEPHTPAVDEVSKKTRVTEFPSADPAFAQALKHLLVAQEFYPSKYEQFKKDLELTGVSFIYSDPRFLDALVEFSKSFQSFLNDPKTPKEQLTPRKTAEEAVPRGLAESLAKELPRITDHIDTVKRKKIELITEAYVSGLRTISRVRDEGALKELLTTEASRLIKESKDPRELREKMEKAFARIAAEGARSTDFGNQAQPVAASVLKKADKTLRALVAPYPSEEEITRAVIESPITRKDLWLTTYIELSSFEASPRFEVVDRLAAVAEALYAKPPEGGSYNPIVFSKVGIQAIQQPIRSVLDGVLRFYPKDVRDNIIESVLIGGWEASSKAGRVQERLGRLVIDSPLFERAMNHGNQTFGKGEGRARNFIWDLATSVAGPPVAIDVAILEILGVAPQSYSITQVEAASAHSRAPGLFHLFFDQAAGWGLRKGAGAVAAKAGGTWFGRLLGGLAGGIGGPVTAALGAIFGGAIFGKIGSFFSSLFGRRAAGVPQKWYEDFSMTGIMLPLALVVAPLILIVWLMSMKMIEELGTFQGGQTGGEDVDLSRYIRVTKTANPSSFPDNNATSVTYTITVEATERALSGVTVSESAAVYAKNGNPAPPSVPEAIPVGGDITPGRPFTYEFTTALGPRFKDALIVNTVTVKADAGDAKGEQSITSAVVTVGNPPAACFVPADSGPADTCGSGGRPRAWGGDWSMVVAASQKLAQYPGIMDASGCMENPITAYRVRKKFGGGCFSGGAIYLYNGGVSSFGTAVYTLAHELGHVIDHGTDCFEDFHSQNIYNREGYDGEGGLPTYPNANTEHEDFAETIGLYVGHTVYYPSRWNAYPKYPSAFPLHYSFADSLNKGALSCGQ